MSDYTRSFLGQSPNLGSAFDTAANTASDFHVWRVMPLPDGLLVGARPETADPTSTGDEKELGRLRDHFLLHYFRLERAERRLAQKRRGAGPAGFIARIEEERKRLGRELHSGVAQSLTAIKLQLDEIERLLPNALDAVKAAIARIRQLTAEALSIVRSVSHRLHPPDWQLLTLSAALERLWELSGVPQNFAAELRIDPLPSEPGLHVKTVLYRAAQEALSNLSRHARPSRARLSLQFEDADLVLRVSNDGVADATDPGLAEKRTWGIGLHALRDQLQALGGRMQLFRTTHEFTLEVRIPFTGGSDDAY